MSNQLSMEKVLSIKQLHASGWSIRRISRSLSIDRKTVKRHLLGADSKGTTAAAQAPTAHDEVQGASKGTTQVAKAPTAELTESQRENGKSRSICHALHDVIVQGIERQLTAQRIYQDLVNDHCFKGSYWSVNRYPKVSLDPSNYHFDEWRNCLAKKPRLILARELRTSMQTASFEKRMCFE